VTVYLLGGRRLAPHRVYIREDNGGRASMESLAGCLRMEAHVRICYGSNPKAIVDRFKGAGCQKAVPARNPFFEAWIESEILGNG